MPEIEKEMPEIDSVQLQMDAEGEYLIRRWFCVVELEQALDTFRVIEGIIQARSQGQPARKRRSDAGKKRQGSLREG